MPDLAGQRTRLEAKLAELMGRRETVERDLAEPPDPDSGERSVQMEDDEALDYQSDLLSQEIASIRRALDRIEDGSYGTCAKCGADISAGRLEARPEAALCITCAREAD